MERCLLLLYLPKSNQEIMAGKKNTTVFSWSAIARKCGFKYDYIRLGRLSDEEKANTKEAIEKDASALLGKTYKLIEQTRENNACSGNCNTCLCTPTE